MNRSMVRVSRVVVTLAILGVAMGGVHPAGAQEARSLIVTPSTGLLEGQEVAVSGSGFASNRVVYMSMCTPGASTLSECEGGGSIVTAATDAEGSFAATYLIRRFIYPIDGGITDCALVTCVIGATESLSDPSASAQAPIELVDVPIPTPTVAVSDVTGLVDGQEVEVTGSGFSVGERVGLGQCPPGATTFNLCFSRTNAVADETGAIRGEVSVQRLLTFGVPPDCASGGCTIGVSSFAGLQQIGIGFAEPQLTVTIDPYATLKAGTNDVVAQATVSCDIATPIYLTSGIAQPGVDFHYVLIDQCSPSEPLRAFLPSRFGWETTNDYTLGSAEVTVKAYPLLVFDQLDPSLLLTEHTASVQLIDFDAILTVVQAALADPANTELRAQIQQAIVLRFAQDPVFRAEFIALLNNVA